MTSEFDTLFETASKEKTFGDKIEERVKKEFFDPSKKDSQKELQDLRERKTKLEFQLSKLRNARLPRLRNSDLNKDMVDKRKKKREEIASCTTRIAELEAYVQGQ